MTKKELIERLVQERNAVAEDTNLLGFVEYQYVGKKVVYNYYQIGDRGDTTVTTINGFIDVLIPPVVKDEDE